LAEKDIAIVFWYKMRCIVLSSYVKQLLEFQILESEFQFDFSTVEFETKNPTRISGIRNGFKILLPMGVPEIGTENWNSQPRAC
jgi:hypothetical protein